MSEIKEDTEEIKKLENTRLSITQKENKSPKRQWSGAGRGRRSTARSPTFRSTVHLEFKRKYNTRHSLKRKSVSAAEDDKDDINDTKARSNFHSDRIHSKKKLRRKYKEKSNKRKLLSESEDDSEEEHDLLADKDIIVSKRSRRPKVMFPWSRPMQRDIDLMRSDHSEEENSSSQFESESESDEPKKRIVQRQSRSTYDPSAIPSPEEITQRMLDNIAEKATGKDYDAKNGTSCHQCRQKTRDTKTVCRSGECIGVRGQFCGPCLKGRYGESAFEALQDPVSIDSHLNSILWKKHCK